MLPNMMMHRSSSPLLTWSSRFATVLVTAGLVAGCASQQTGGAAVTAPGDATAGPPGGMGPGAIVAPAVTPSVAPTATSAPIVPVATVVRAATTAPTAVPASPTDVPVPPSPVPATQAPTTPQPKPTERATATRPPATPSPEATAKGTPAPTATPHIVNYTVQKGDDVYAIARRFGVTPAAIISANSLANPSKIKIGQVLKVPVTGTPSEPPTA